MTEQTPVSRREFLAFAGIGGTLFGWWPWHHPKQIALAGAQFQIIRNKRAARRYLLIHGNEETARQVLTKHMETHLGTAYIIDSRTREVAIESGKIDPNRMFSRTGAEISLRNLNPNWSDEQRSEALDLLDEGRERFLQALFPPQGGLMFALHNNSEDYSVKDELELSEQMSLGQPDQPHAFFLCTSPRDYGILATAPYNVVLQQHVRAPDDGSLSRRAAARYVRYVNLEVRLGDAARQQEMLDWAEGHLG